MRFITFVKQNADQSDPALKSFSSYLKHDKNFPLSSNPYNIALYLYDKIDHLQTRGFQTYMMMYRNMEPKNQLPVLLKNDENEFLQAINAIVSFQHQQEANKTADKYIPTRPLEYVCFYPIDFPTKQGDVYFFMAVDAYSHFLMEIGYDNVNDDKAILKHIRLLMQNENFKKHRNNGFNLVLHKYHHLTNEINSIIHPFKGKLIIDDLYLSKIVIPVIEHFYELLAKQK